MKTYTEEEVNQLIKTAITETSQGFLEWLRNETDVVDKNTKEVLHNTEITLKPEKNGLMKKYIYPRLEKQGIIITNENKK